MFDPDDLDSASIKARIVEILGPQVGPGVARKIIESAIPGYCYRPVWDGVGYSRLDGVPIGKDPTTQLQEATPDAKSKAISEATGWYQQLREAMVDKHDVFKRKRGRPPSSLRRQHLAIDIAFVLDRAGVSLSKTHTGRSQISSDFAKVLSVVFRAVDEPVPNDMFDIIKTAIEQVEFERLPLWAYEGFPLNKYWGG